MRTLLRLLRRPVLGFGVLLAATSPAARGSAEQGGAVELAAFALRESAWVAAGADSIQGRLAVRAEIALPGTAVPGQVSVTLGDLRLETTLTGGRGTAESVGADRRARLRATVTEGVLHLDVRGRSRASEGLAHATSVLDRYLRDGYFHGPAWGLVEGLIEVDGVALPLVVGQVGRMEGRVRATRSRPDLLVRGIAITAAPGGGLREACAIAAPRGQRGDWSGRIRAHALAVGAPPVLTLRRETGETETLAPATGEMVGYGGYTHVAEGVAARTVGDTVVYHVRADVPVPCAELRGRTTLTLLAGETPCEASIEVPIVTKAAPAEVQADVHVLETREDGSLWAWGENLFGQVGTGSRRAPSRPWRIGQVRRPARVAAGGTFSAVLDERGEVWQWGGWFDRTELGPGSSVTEDIGTWLPSKVEGLPPVVEIAAGDDHLLAVTGSGDVWSWGQNLRGQLGVEPSGGTWAAPRKPPLAIAASAVAAGTNYSLALGVDGSVWAWGDHRRIGETGNTAPAAVTGLPPITAIDAGGVPLALDVDGCVWTWGCNEDAELGDGTTTFRAEPVRIPGLSGIVKISSGDFHALALRSDGVAFGWGRNVSGELGDGGSAPTTTPVVVRQLRGLVSVEAGVFHSLAEDANGDLWVWGWVFWSRGPIGWASGSSGVLPMLEPRGPRR